MFCSKSYHILSIFVWMDDKVQPRCLNFPTYKCAKQAKSKQKFEWFVISNHRIGIFMKWDEYTVLVPLLAAATVQNVFWSFWLPHKNYIKLVSYRAEAANWEWLTVAQLRYILRHYGIAERFSWRLLVTSSLKLQKKNCNKNTATKLRKT